MVMATLRMLYVPMELISIIRSFLLCCCWYNFYYTLLSSICSASFSSFTYILLSIATYCFIYITPLVLSLSLSSPFLLLIFPTLIRSDFVLMYYFQTAQIEEEKKTSQHSNFLPHKCTNTDVLVYIVYISHLLVCVQNRTQLTSRSIIYDLNR